MTITRMAAWIFINRYLKEEKDRKDAQKKRKPEKMDKGKRGPQIRPFISALEGGGMDRRSGRNTHVFREALKGGERTSTEPIKRSP